MGLQPSAENGSPSRSLRSPQGHNARRDVRSSGGRPPRLAAHSEHPLPSETRNSPRSSSPAVAARRARAARGAPCSSTMATRVERHCRYTASPPSDFPLLASIAIKPLLTYMLTLPILSQQRWVARWIPAGNELALRAFYYFETWKIGVDGLEGATKSGVIRPPSPRGRVLGLVERFVCGDPKATLVRPQGDGMDPVFKRLRCEHKGLVRSGSSRE
jgi:hypothetical protein